MPKIYKLIISLVIPLLAGSIGSLFTSPNIPNWYDALNKSSLNPPGWVFGPVWTLLYILMGWALFLVWSTGTGIFSRELAKIKRYGLIAFAIQMVLNMMWSIIFFGLRNPGVAFVEIIVLWVAIVITAIIFFKVKRGAGYLMLPYVLWVTFAGYLNYSILVLN